MNASSEQDAVSTRKYWDEYYAMASKNSRPSQFAAFILGEIDKGSNFLDVGCGNGRDAMFFASHGFSTLGIDGSDTAVTNCGNLAKDLHLSNVSFIQSNISDTELSRKAGAKIDLSVPLTIYARFFLHAIDDQGEEAFFKMAHDVCKPGDRVTVEYRTVRDALQPKVTPDHFRRYIEPMTVVERAISHGFVCKYHVEGFGMAKYKNDDAHVARNIFVRA